MLRTSWYAVRYKDNLGGWHWGEKHNTKGPGLYSSPKVAKAAQWRKFDPRYYRSCDSAEVIEVILQPGLVIEVRKEADEHA